MGAPAFTPQQARPGQDVEETREEVEPKHEKDRVAQRGANFRAAKQGSAAAHNGDEAKHDGGKGETFQDSIWFHGVFVRVWFGRRSPVDRFT